MGSYSQETNPNLSGFRRHFIIAYDIKLDNLDDSFLRDSLVSLFESGKMTTKQSSNIETGKSKDLFFDPINDEISCYHFGISRNDFPELEIEMLEKPYKSKNVESAFVRHYITNKQLSWSTSKLTGNSLNSRLTSFFTNFWKLKPDPNFCNNGITCPEFVFPFILSGLPSDSYAEEYILIIISFADYRNDMNQFFAYYATGTPALTNITSHRNTLLSKLSSTYCPEQSFINNQLGARLYKISIPFSELKNTPAFEYKIISRITMKQAAWHQSEFTTSAVEIKVPENNAGLQLNAIKLLICRNGNPPTPPFIDLPIAWKNNDNWESEIIKDTEGLSEKGNQNILIPGITLQLDSLSIAKTFPNLKFQYSFYTSYNLSKETKINFLLKTEQIVPSDNINSSSSKRLYMELAIVGFVLVIVLFLFLIGKPIGVEYDFLPINDSFESIDTTGEGRMNRPYLPWSAGIIKKNEYPVKVTFTVIYLLNDYWFNWSGKISVNIDKFELPSDFKIFIKGETSSVGELPSSYNRLYKFGKDNRYFYFIIRQNGFFKEPSEIHKTAIKGFIRIHSRKVVKESRIDYKFYIGPDLGDCWTGIDPGTTGTCIAMGRLQKAIELSEIYPSKIAFNTAIHLPDWVDDLHKFDLFWKENPQLCYLGEAAYSFVTTLSSKDTRIFESIKKLLGFPYKEKVGFNKTMEFSGTDLTYLMVNGLLHKFKQNLVDKSADPDIRDLLSDGELKSKRAIITIPNNFTLKKILDLVKAINMLDQFKEIRYIYEAEAIFFDYLSDRDFEKSTSENVLIFDMGGATINVTALHYELDKKTSKHKIEIKSKIGYSIGGDSIDYYIKEHMFNEENSLEYPVVSSTVNDSTNYPYKIFHKIIYHNGIQMLKQSIATNFILEKDKLISTNDLQPVFYDFIDKSDISPQNKTQYKKIIADSLNTGDSDLNFIKSFSLNNGKYGFNDKNANKKIFDLYNENLYSFVTDAINETMEFSKLKEFDKIIIAGRSTLFPFIKEKVFETLKLDSKSEKVIKLKNLKTAVAKGACWYGIHRGSIQLENFKINANFGITETVDPIKQRFVFHTIIPAMTPYIFRDKTSASVTQKVSLSSDFKYDDSNLVNFYMAMSPKPLEDIKKNKKEKYQKLCDIHTPTTTRSIEITVSNTDQVTCTVETQNDQRYLKDPLMEDLEIKGSNNEHHLFWSLSDNNSK
jgi:hypothetical protein